ncbi:hypothetical protein FRC02_010729 [Tulasnella sp. 418]|nr:hypothetical protein FRC02_010729 [Tulasnella sp. 418]
MVDPASHSLHPQAQFRTSLSAVVSAYYNLPWTRRHKRVSSIVLLVALFCLSFFVFKTQSPSSITHSTESHSFIHNAQSRLPNGYWARRVAKRLKGESQQSQLDSSHDNSHNRHHHGHVVSKHEPLVFNDAEELAAVVNFVTALSSNAITNVDPNVPVPPELLVGFNTRAGEKSRQELKSLVQNTWFEHPVVIFSETRSPRARELKDMIASYKLLPVPTVIEVDGRDDAEILTRIITRLTKSESLPVLLVAGKPFGTLDDIKVAHENGELKAAIQASGAVLNGSQKRKKKKLAQYNPKN